MESFTKKEKKKFYGGRGAKEHMNINFKSILENSNIMYCNVLVLRIMYLAEFKTENTFLVF